MSRGEGRGRPVCTAPWLVWTGRVAQRQAIFKASWQVILIYVWGFERCSLYSGSVCVPLISAYVSLFVCTLVLLGTPISPPTGGGVISLIILL